MNDLKEKHNVPYHYEAPLYLKGRGIIHPDFTVLNIRTRQEYYWEPNYYMSSCFWYFQKSVFGYT